MADHDIIDIEAVRRRNAARPQIYPREHSCLCCQRPFLSTDPGNRVCLDCRTNDTAASAVEGRSA